MEGRIDHLLGELLAVTGTVQALNDGRFDLVDPMLGGTPVNPGPRARLRAGGVDSVLASARLQAYHRNHLEHPAIGPAFRALPAMKSIHHFRAAFASTASRMAVVDDVGNLTRRSFRDPGHDRLQRPPFLQELD